MDVKQIKKIPLYRHTSALPNPPIIDKSAITENFPHNWMTEQLAEDMKEGRVLLRTSSGTSSDRMQVMLPQDWRQKELHHTFKQLPILEECLKAGLTRIALTTAVCSQTLCFREDPGPEKRVIGGTLFLNLSHDPNTWQKSDIKRMLSEMKNYAPYFLDVDPFYLAHFLLCLKQFKYDDQFIKPQLITLGYELCTQNIRSYIESALSVPVIDIYGSTELGYVLLENTPGNMVLSSRESTMEYLPIDSDSGLFALVVTSTKNPYMPLIRYRTGDCVQIHNSNDKKNIIRICGREKELIKTSNGKIVAQIFVDDIIKATSANIAFYQLRRLPNQFYHLNYCTFNHHELTKEEQENLARELSSLLESDCQLKHRRSIAASHSGKFSWLVTEEPS